jgi:hypothetical protein
MARLDRIPDTMTAANFSHLKDLCSAYFHEDWTLDGDGPDHILSSYIAAGWRAAELEDVAAQANRFADAYADDAALEQALLSELGCYYLPSADGISARQWLHHVASVLREAASRTRAQ